MPKDTLDLPLIGREAMVRADTINEAERTIDIIWTTGATVQRARWDGWDDRVEYDEELLVDGNSIRLDRLNDGAPFLDSHRTSGGVANVLGSVVRGSVRVENGQGTAKIRLTSADDAAPAIQRILERTINKVSVGYRVYRYEITKTDGARDLWRAVDWEPFEISAVAMPADPGATIRSEQSGRDNRNPCVIIRRETSAAQAASGKEAEMPKDNPNAAGDETTAVRTDTGQQTRAAQTTPSPAAQTTPSPAADAIRAEERARSAEIGTLCSRHGLDASFRDQLIRDGVSLDHARSQILDKLVETDPAGRTAELAPAQARGTGEREVQYRDAMTEALMHRHNPGRHALTANGREFRGLSLIEMARHALDRAGVSTRGMSKMELASLAFQARASVGYHSTSDFPAILANVANKTLRAAYDGTPRTFGAWARRATITDFKPVQRTQLGGAPDLEKVLESGEFQYGTIGEAKEVYGLATYGRIVSITRQTLINDDLDAFTRVPAAFGASAADLESDIVYAILMQNPAMADGVNLFDAGHSNLGTAGVIGETSLSEAYRKFAQQTGIEGRKISTLPQYILVPPGNRSVEARKQVTATTPSSTADVNPYAGRMQVIEEPRLIPSSGQDPWFLAADPSRIDTVEYAYLDGQEGVFTETRMGFEVDGMEIKARHDFAAKAIDWRGLFKNAGAAPA
jgi:hypothetical protein